MFNVKIKNFFWATLFGITPQLFLIVSLGSGLEQIIEKNIQVPKIKDMLFSPEIYFPMLAFGGMIILTFVVKKYFFNKN